MDEYQVHFNFHITFQVSFGEKAENHTKTRKYAPTMLCY